MPFPETATRRLTGTGEAMLVAISPDGRRFAAVHREGSLSRLWIDLIGGGERRALTNAAGIHFRGLTFSPKGDALYYVAAVGDRLLSALYCLPLDDRTDEIHLPEQLPKHLIEDVDSPVTFSPDGLHLAFVRNDPRAQETTLYVGSADGLNLRALSTRQRPEFFSLYGLAWSPDGERIAVAASAGPTRMAVVEIDAATGVERMRGSATWQRLGALAWDCRDGSLFAAAWDGDPFINGDQIWRLPPNAADARRVTEDESPNQGLSLTATGNALATVSFNRRSRIWVGGEIGRNAEVSTATPVTAEVIESANGHVGIDWTADGGLLYNASLGSGADLWIAGANGEPPQMLVENAIMPAVTSDGRRIAFVSGHGMVSGGVSGGAPGGTTREAAIWIFDYGRKTSERLTAGKGELAPAFSPDGRWLVYEASPADHPRLWRIPATGGAAEQLTDYYAARPAISPDGHWIAFYHLDRQASGMKIAIVPFDVDIAHLPIPKRTFHHPPPSPPLLRWTPDSRAVVYCVTRGGVSNLWAQPIHGEPPRRLTGFDADRIFGFAWSRDGRRLACARGRIESDAVLITGLN